MGSGSEEQIKAHNEHPLEELERRIKARKIWLTDNYYGKDCYAVVFFELNLMLSEVRRIRMKEWSRRHGPIKGRKHKLPDRRKK